SWGNSWGITQQPTGGFVPAWFWRRPKKLKSEYEPTEVVSTVVERISPEASAADVAAAIGAAQALVKTLYRLPTDSVPEGAYRVATVSLPFPLPADTSDEDAIALMLLLAED
ncbi:MAG: hypothetical protein ACO29C_05880, partial [Fluviibacter sp.]